MTSECIYTAEFIAKPGMIDELISVLSALIEPTRQEDGCLRYELNQDVEHPDRVLFIEKFRNKAAFDVHMNSSYVRHFADNQLPHLVQQVTFKAYRELSKAAV